MTRVPLDACKVTQGRRRPWGSHGRQGYPGKEKTRVPMNGNVTQGRIRPAFPWKARLLRDGEDQRSHGRQGYFRDGEDQGSQGRLDYPRKQEKLNQSSKRRKDYPRNEKEDGENWLSYFDAVRHLTEAAFQLSA